MKQALNESIKILVMSVVKRYKEQGYAQDFRLITNGDKTIEIKFSIKENK